ncbi:MAG: hypothetical protein EOM12_15085, partial [Verrucomicrobiae bacterium]|nr:hypothetical protein [Verrucomicrobiae bacterium]
MNIRVFLTLCLLSVSFSVFSAESTRTVTGFYYPVGTENLQISSCGRWLTKPIGVVGGCYPSSGIYHIGVDLWVDVGDDVRAISDGKVIQRSETGWSNDGTDNIALLVEHESAEYGSFTALYGHVRRSGAKLIGSSVRSGEKIGEIGSWIGGAHLHFGIVHPNLNTPINDGYGRWQWNKWGVPNGIYYDNGLIDPIDFIVHSGPDNYISRGSESIPNPITTESAWFYDLCWAQAPDGRCEMADVDWYLVCTEERSTLCAVDPSVWSAVGETGLTSANTYAVGGDGYIPPENPQPNDPVNLTQDTDIFGADGNELYAGHNYFIPGMKASVRVTGKAKGGDAGNWKNRDDADTIDIAYYVSYDDGPWTQWTTGYMTIGKLDEDVEITETKSLTIPQGISSIAFRIDLDYRNEVDEYDEGDNESRVERFEVSSLLPNYTVSDVFFSDPNTGARYYSGATLLEDQYWYPYCEIASIGETNAPIAVEVSHRMDGSERDTDTLETDEISVGSFATETVWSKWKLGDTGTRTYTCCVDSTNQLPELNEGDNCKSATYNV